MQIENTFDFSKEDVVRTVKHMAGLMDCDYFTAYTEYTHELLKSIVSWDELEPMLQG